MRVGVLGPFELTSDGRPLSPGGARQRSVLAYLALNANQVVPAGQLLIDLWGEQAPDRAMNALQAAVSRIRKVIPSERLITRAPGYLLALEPDELDLGDFTELAAEGRQHLRAGRHDEASGTLRRALALWRGPALADFRYEPFAQAEIAWLEELRLTCREDRIEADLAGTSGADLVGELRRLVAEHPFRERLSGQLARALYRDGRQREALAALRELRQVLRQDLGVDPSPELARLEWAVLRHDPTLNRPAGPPARAASAASAAGWPPGRPAERRLVTVLSTDLSGRIGARSRAGSSAGSSGGSSGDPIDDPIDPEAAEHLLERAARLLQPVLDRYGGRLVPEQRGRLVAAFGLADAHEDDALRAVRAAVDARAALRGEADSLRRHTGWRLDCRFVVTTDEALVGGRQPGYLGPATGRATVLLADAGPWQILLDPQTRELAGAATVVRSRPGGRLELAEVHPLARPLPVRLDGPLVGRDDVLDRLLATVADSRRTRRAVLVPVIGDAGIGKTRTVLELARRLEPDTLLLTGRCLPYGDGITFWPLRDLLDQLGRLEPLAALLDAEPDAAEITGRLARTFGEGPAGTADTAEIGWATRRLLETLARRRPLVVVLEDLHWAEPTFLDLVESVVRQADPVPLTLLCLGRPELLEQRPWRSAFADLLVELGPLSQGPAAALVDTLAGPGTDRRAVRDRILAAGGGNPLYLEQLVAAAAEPGGVSGDRVPPSLQALLAARLDRLGPGERIALSCAAVVGRDFDRDAVAVLLPEPVRTNLDRYLHDLVRRGLLQRLPDPDDRTSRQPGRHMFRHNLIQQAAYRAIPKAARADWHQLLADWIATDPATPPAERADLLGYHLERAAVLHRELRPLDPGLLPLLRRAADQLVATAATAHELGDAAGAVRLFERADALLPEADPGRAEVLTGLGAALLDAGRLDDAGRALDRAAALAVEHEAAGPLAHARVQALLLGLHLDPAKAENEAERILPELHRTLTELGDQLGLCRVWMVTAAVHWNNARSAAAEQAWQRAADHARAAGDRRHLADCLSWLASAALWGPSAVDDGIARCEHYLAELDGIPTSRAEVRLYAAGLHAMRDDLDRAQELLARGLTVLEDLGASLPTAVTEPAALVALLSGRPERAEVLLRREYESLRGMGERAQLATVAGMLARTLVEQGPSRYPEAERLVEESRRASGDADPSATVLADGALARILSARGDHAEAERRARSAVTVAAGTDLISQHADALLDLAGVLAAGGRREQAAESAQRAADLYRAKGNRRGIRHCDRLLVRFGRD